MGAVRRVSGVSPQRNQVFPDLQAENGFAMGAVAMTPESQPKCHSPFERQPPLETPVLRGLQQGVGEKTAEVRSETARARLGVFLLIL